MLTFDTAALGDAPHAAAARVGDGDVTASLGMVSALGPAWRTWRGGEIDRFIRLDLSIHDGFSGGAAVTATGEIVGVNSSGLARGSAVTVPAVTVERVVEPLLTGGRTTRGYLGAGMRLVRLPERLVASLGLTSDAGLIVLGVEGGGPADRGGLHGGDVVVALGGAPVRDPADVLDLLEPDRVGQLLVARVGRAGVLADVPLTVGERPRREARLASSLALTIVGGSNAAEPGGASTAERVNEHHLDVLLVELGRGDVPGSDTLPPPQPRTPRELPVLGLLAAGLANKQIAGRLRISEHTVKFHVAAVFEKLGAGTRAEAVAIGARRGVVMH